MSAPTRRTARTGAAAVVAAVAAIAVACGGGAGGGQNGQTPSPTPAPTASPTAGETSTECAAVSSATRNLTSQVQALVAGQTSREQVATAGRDLAAALDAARDTLGPNARAGLDAAGAAVGQLETALTTQPLDTAAVRSAAGQVAASVRSVLDVCGGSTSTTSTTP
ncbi:hypothetical protein [Amycolatopsis sp. FDAARGOS 1241]|uniref:hypothetical protein n=1 Tax=Amycolatopsis sp. FDAARGOS 1241 TaxID=2778070 RepID=UPI00194E0B3C|nr:hypothetical protein [Amycolatopsis sp. FDAARGOS 1241]QRP49178.1 hypothetical protein I6J71_16180 [Amycolatopsis sp. FDAARGOS 1241]